MKKFSFPFKINFEDGDLAISLGWAGAVFLLFYVAFPLPEFVPTLWFGAKFTHFLFAFAAALIGFLFGCGTMVFMDAYKENRKVATRIVVYTLLGMAGVIFLIIPLVAKLFVPH